MGINSLEETGESQRHLLFCNTGNGSSNLLLSDRKCESEQISNILKYGESKISSNIDQILENEESDEIVKYGRNGMKYGEKITLKDPLTKKNYSYDNDIPIDTGDKYVLPTFSNNIQLKSNYLENITEEQVDINKKDSVDESIEGYKGNDVEDIMSGILANNGNNSSENENNLKVPNASSDNIDQKTTKYSCSFLDDQKVQEELFQQNILAQQLLVKYFNEEERPEKSGGVKKEESKATKRAVALLQNVSSILRRFTHIADKGEQVCIKPSDMYIYMNDDQNKFQPDSTLRFLRPFRYHRNYSDSTTNLNFGLPMENCIRRTRFCYESDTIHDSLLDIRKRSFENVQFLNAKLTHSGHYNKILYKNDSRNLENNFSDEDLEGWNYPILSERYLSLRNLYSYSHLGSNKSRYYFQTLPRTSGLVGLKFDNGIDFKVSDEEYKLWLKQNDFVKYTDYSITSNSSSSIPKTSTEEPTDISTSQTSAKLELVPYHRSSQEKYNHFDDYFGNINYEQLYQLILYEHVVISNCINFFSCYFFAKRLKKLSICDRMVQLLFFIMCYYVMVFLNEAGIRHLADGISYRNVFK